MSPRARMTNVRFRFAIASCLIPFEIGPGGVATTVVVVEVALIVGCRRICGRENNGDSGWCCWWERGRESGLATSGFSTPPCFRIAGDTRLLSTAF
jgi:hypothetical protein